MYRNERGGGGQEEEEEIVDGIRMVVPFYII